jgi:hypothetical protein
MIKLLFSFISIAVMAKGCPTEEEVFNKWIGKTGQDLIEKAGPPANITTNGGNGKVYIYSKSFTNTYNGWTRYDHLFFYLDSNLIVYKWMKQSNNTPPQQIIIR